MLANDSQYWVGSGWVQIFPLVGLGWVSHLMGWVGSSRTKWTHGQLWTKAEMQKRKENERIVEKMHTEQPVVTKQG